MSHPTRVAFLLALLAQPRPKHSDAVLLGDIGAIYGMDLGAGVLFHHHRLGRRRSPSLQVQRSEADQKIHADQRNQQLVQAAGTP